MTKPRLSLERFVLAKDIAANVFMVHVNANRTNQNANLRKMYLIEARQAGIFIPPVGEPRLDFGFPKLTFDSHLR